MAKGRMTPFTLYTMIITMVMIFSASYYGAHCALYGESCGDSNLCVGYTLRCSGTCVCATGYEHVTGEDVCQGKEETLDPDYRFSDSSIFKTDMTKADLDRARQNSIRTELEEQLYEIFRNVSGFKDVAVTSIQITGDDLQADWVVTLDANSPSFANMTREEASSLVKKDLEDVKLKYQDSILIDTSKHGSNDDDDDLWIGVGIGIGCAVLIIIVVIIVSIVLLRKKEARRDLTGAVEQRSTSGKTNSTRGGSSQLDGDDYQYSVFKKDDFSVPPYYSHPAPPSESSSIYAVIDDKRPLN